MTWEELAIANAKFDSIETHEEGYNWALDWGGSLLDFAAQVLRAAENTTYYNSEES